MGFYFISKKAHPSVVSRGCAVSINHHLSFLWLPEARALLLPLACCLLPPPPFLPFGLLYFPPGSWLLLTLNSSLPQVMHSTLSAASRDSPNIVT